MRKRREEKGGTSPADNWLEKAEEGTSTTLGKNE